VEVADGLALNGLSLLVGGPGAIELTVTDAESGAALRDASIRLRPWGLPRSIGATAGEDGKARLENLPAGSYDLEVEAAGRKLAREEIEVKDGRAERTVWLRSQAEGE